MASIVAVGMKVVGVLLIIALAIILLPRQRGALARTPEQMAVIASLIGIAVRATIGLFGSLWIEHAVRAFDRGGGGNPLRRELRDRTVRQGARSVGE